jgi:hypothetical protein
VPAFTAASRENLRLQHRGNFKSTPHKKRPQTSAHQMVADCKLVVNRTAVRSCFGCGLEKNHTEADHTDKQIVELCSCAD